MTILFLPCNATHLRLGLGKLFMLGIHETWTFLSPFQDKDTVTIPCMLVVYCITENKTKSPHKDCIIFCLYYYVFHTLGVFMSRVAPINFGDPGSMRPTQRTDQRYCSIYFLE